MAVLYDPGCAEGWLWLAYDLVGDGYAAPRAMLNNSLLAYHIWHPATIPALHLPKANEPCTYKGEAQATPEDGNE